MGVRAAGLSAIKVRTASPGRYGDGDGLYLFVRSADAAFWVFRYTRSGRMREMGLGRARGQNAVTLAEARVRGGELHRAVRAGRDPLADRDQEAAAAKAAEQTAIVQATTFRMVADAHVAANESAWRNPKHRKQWPATLLAYAYPHFGDVAVADVTTAHVLAALEPIWHTKPETAARLRGRIETVLTAAQVRGLRGGQNPAAWKGHLAEILPARGKVAPIEHHPALPWKQVGGFMASLRLQDGVSARALEFAILTAGRTGEVLGATWGEIDLAARIWALPPSRMKAKREHRVPLSDAALAIVRDMAGLFPHEPGSFLFPSLRSTRQLSDMAMIMTLRRMKRDDLTTHGFRSSFRDWVAEATEFQGEVAEAALAHVVGDKVEAAYRRGDLFEKRRAMMDAWAAFCGRPSKAEGQLLHMRQAQS